jgi:branched-chain amino acid transport system ATP-binding protein
MIGPNGAGKTTCFNSHQRAAAPDAGEVPCRRAINSGSGARERCRLGIGRSFQVAATFGSMTRARKRPGCVALEANGNRSLSSFAATDRAA